MPSPRKRKLKKLNSNRKSAIRARAAKGATPAPAPAAEEAAPVVEEVVEKVAEKPKKTRKKKALWSKKTSE